MDNHEFNAKRLANLRENMKLSRREIILKLHDLGVDIAENTLANWEEGNTTPNSEMLVPLSKVFGVEVKTWLGK